jgi:hypothetical protein
MRPMPRRVRVAVALGIACATLAAVVGTRGSWPPIELFLDVAPLIALALPLLLGRYVGEKLIAACRERRAGHRCGREPRAAALRPAHRVRVSGGRLIAAALAERGPPRARLSCV